MVLCRDAGKLSSDDLCEVLSMGPGHGVGSVNNPTQVTVVGGNDTMAWILVLLKVETLNDGKVCCQEDSQTPQQTSLKELDRFPL